MENESTSVESVYALVEDGMVINTIVWDGDSSSWQPPPGQVTVRVSDDEQVVSVGWLYDGIRFIEPRESDAR
jgi:hypothetical protein